MHSSFRSIMEIPVKPYGNSLSDTATLITECVLFHSSNPKSVKAITVRPWEKNNLKVKLVWC